jgi:uncharacterized membrane protein YdbT with pleckstrin-like domain
VATYISKILQDDEQIVHQTRVHRIVYLPSLLLLIAAIVLLIWFAPAYQAGGREFVGMVGAFAGVAALLMSPYYFFKALIQRTTTELAITNRRVIAKVGLIRRKTWEINATKVEGVHVDQSIFGRLLGYGTVTVKGTGGGIAPMRTIDDPVEFRKHVTSL